MRWRKTDKDARLARQIVESKLERLVQRPDAPARQRLRVESVEEYMRRGGKVIKLPPQ